MAWIFTYLLLIVRTTAYKYDPALTEYNLNQNQTGVNPLDFCK